MPIAEIAGEWAGQQSIDPTCAASQRLLCRPDQDKGQTLLDRLEVGPKIDGAAGGLSHDRHLWTTVEKQASRVDGAIGTETEPEFAAQFTRHIGLHALGGIRAEPDGGDDRETACLALRGRECLRAAPTESGGQPREEPGRTDSSHGLSAGRALGERTGEGIELLRIHMRASSS